MMLCIIDKRPKQSWAMLAVIWLFASCADTPSPTPPPSDAATTTTVTASLADLPAPEPLNTLSGSSSFILSPPADTFPAEPVADLHESLIRAAATIEAQYKSDPTVSRGCFTPPLALQAPSNLQGMEPEWIRVYGQMPLGASVKVRFTDPTDPQRWVDLWQGEGCYGVLPSPPPGATEVVEPSPVSIPGIDASAAPTIQRWKGWDGSAGVLLVGCSTTNSCDLTGNNVDVQTVVDIAASLGPVS